MGSTYGTMVGPYSLRVNHVGQHVAVIIEPARFTTRNFTLKVSEVGITLESNEDLPGGGRVLVLEDLRQPASPSPLHDILRLGE